MLLRAARVPVERGALQAFPAGFLYGTDCNQVIGGRLVEPLQLLLVREAWEAEIIKVT